VVVLVVALVLISRFWVQDEVATSEDRFEADAILNMRMAVAKGFPMMMSKI
jgi:hypothetical protein